MLAHRTTALTMMTGVRCGAGMVIMIVSQYDKTGNLALHNQTLWVSLSLFQHNKITFPYLGLTINTLLHVN